jgi:fatty acid desaturase
MQPFAARYPAATTPAPTRRKVADVLTREEIAKLTARSDLRGGWAVLSTWAIIAGAFALLARWTGPLTLLAALVVVGGRQLALAILMHDASHGSLFRTPWLNRVVGDWVCGRPIWNDLPKYRAHHLVHHAKAGTEEDVDISLVASLPTTRPSMARKFARDMLGVTGLKFLLGRLLMDAGVLEFTVAHALRRRPRDGRAWYHYVVSALRNMTPMLLTNAVLFGVLAATRHPWVYGVWVLSYMTTFSLFVRIRSMAEHACARMTTDVFGNTRTTRAGWLARMTVAPVRVNYHLEHHFVMTVPYFRLPALHKLLLDRGAIAQPPGYLDVLKMVSSAPAR